MKTQQIRDVKLSIGAQVHQQNIFETQTGIIAIGFLDSLSTIGCRGLDPVHLTQPTFALQGGGGPIIAARNHRDCLHACIAQSLYDAMQHWFTQYVEEVKEGKFPGEENVHKVDLVEFDLIKKTLADMGIVTIPPSESSCR